jgi:hypothetical protein
MGAVYVDRCLLGLTKLKASRYTNVLNVWLHNYNVPLSQVGLPNVRVFGNDHWDSLARLLKWSASCIEQYLQPGLTWLLRMRKR